MFSSGLVFHNDEPMQGSFQKSGIVVRVGIIFGIVCFNMFSGILPFSLHGAPVSSQDYVFERYHPCGDIGFENIYDIELGAGTSVWFASWGDGIALVDETSWRHYSEISESPLPSNFVKSLTFHAERNQLWAATTKGVVVISGDEVQKVSLPLNFEPTSVLINVDQTVFIGSRKGQVITSSLSQFDMSGNFNWETLLEAGPGNSFSVDEMIEDADGNIWVARNRCGVVRLSSGDTRNFTPEETGVKRANQIIRLSDGTLILAGSGTPSRFMEGQWQPISELEAVYRSCELMDGNLIFGKLNGNIISLDGSKTEVLWNPDQSNIRIRSIIQDHNGRIWLGEKGGIRKGAPRRWINSGLVENYRGRFIGIACIYTSSHGFLAINDQNELTSYDPSIKQWVTKLALPGASSYGQEMIIVNGLLRIFSKRKIYDVNLDSFQLVDTNNSPTQTRVTGFQNYGEDGVFLSSMEGCFVWRNGEWGVFEGDGAAYASSVIPRSKTVAIIREDGVELWEDGSLVHVWEEPTRHADTRYYFVEPFDDHTFIAGILGQGLYLLKAGKPYIALDDGKGLYSKRCTSALSATNGDLWVGYEGGGVACLRDGRWVEFDFDNGVLNETVLGIIEHPSGEIWVTTEDYGLFRFNPDQIAPETTMARAPDKLQRNQVAVFAFEGHDGWHETKEEDLVFSWRILSSAEPELSQSSIWSEYSANRSVLIEAPGIPGNYTFQVRAQDRGFNTDMTTATHEFEVTPPFWTTSAFLVPMLGMTCLAGLLAIKVINSHNKIKHHVEELDKRVQERTSELQFTSENLLLEKERLEATIHSTADAIIAIDSEDRITFYNQAALLLVRDGQQLLNGKALHQVFQFSDQISFQSLSRSVNDTFNPNPSGMVTAKAGTGGPVEFEYNTGVVKSGSQILGFVLAFRDRSTMKELECERQRRSNLESLGLVAGGIAHDFNNFLAAILGNISVLEQICPDDPKVKKALEQSRSASINAKSLTKQLFTFAKGGNPILEPGNLAETVRSSAEFCVRGTAHECQFDIDPDLPMVEMDAGQMTHVIHNIVLNAMQSMDHNGIVRITVSKARLRSEIKEWNDDREPERSSVRVSIADTGEGIPADQLDKVFDPYFTSKTNGSGIGLAVCHSIVEQHQGNISIKSEPGHGTVVTIELPVPVQEVVDEAEKKQEYERPSLEKNNI